MEILDSDPTLGIDLRACIHEEPGNRIGNRPESDREQSLPVLGTFLSEQPIGYEFFPYAIPLRLRGREQTEYAARVDPYGNFWPLLSRFGRSSSDRGGITFTSPVISSTMRSSPITSGPS